MAHALPGLGTKPGPDQFVVAPNSAVEKNQRRAGDPLSEIVGDLGAGGEEIEIFAGRLLRDAKAERIAFAVVSGRVKMAFQVPGAFARNRERQDLDARGRAVGKGRLKALVNLDRLAAYVLFVEHVE